MSLTHRQAEELIERRLDGSLAPAVQRRLAEHLAACERCRAYAADAAEWSQHLGSALPALWPERRATPARLAETTRLGQEAIRSRQSWPVAGRALGLGLKAAAAAAAILLIFWFLRPPASTVEEPAFDDTFFQSSEFATKYVSVQLEIDEQGLPGSGFDIYYPICDGIEYFPTAASLAQKLALGEPLPECELRPSKTFLLVPGETQEVLFVYSNPARETVAFRLEPASETPVTEGLNAALCGTAPGGYESGECLTHYARARGLWATYFAFKVPVSAKPGSHVNVTVRVDWERLAEQ